MDKSPKIHEAKSLYEAYRDFGLPTRLLESPRIGFVIINLKEVGFA